MPLCQLIRSMALGSHLGPCFFFYSVMVGNSFWDGRTNAPKVDGVKCEFFEFLSIKSC